jgi:hypothetical protein
LGRLNEQTLIYSLRRPTADGRHELLLTPIKLLDLLAQLVTPPRLHKHRYCGVLAPNAALRESVTASAGPAGATLQLLEQARASMGLSAARPAEPDAPSPLTNLRRAAARCWALLLVRIYECLLTLCKTPSITRSSQAWRIDGKTDRPFFRIRTGKSRAAM